MTLGGLPAGPLAAGTAACEIGQAAVQEPGAAVLTLAEAAELLRLDPDALAAAAARGEVPGRRLLGAWRFHRGALLAWVAGADQPASCFEPELTPSELAATTGAGPAAAEGRQLAQAAPPDQDEAETFGEDPELETAREVALREQVLLRAGELTLEPSLTYARTDRTGLVTVPPGIAFLGTRRIETFSAALAARYGIVDDLQITAGLPLRHRWQEDRAAAPQFSPERSSGTEFGDVALGLRYGLLPEGPGSPSVVLSADSRIPTDGSDAFALGGGLSLVKSLDPTALFASASYLHTFNVEDRGLANLQPADQVNATFGFAFAMNERLSFSTALTSNFSFRTEVGGLTLPADETYNLRLALTALLAENLFVEPSVSFRLNGPADAFTLGLSLPYTLRP